MHKKSTPVGSSIKRLLAPASMVVLAGAFGFGSFLLTASPASADSSAAGSGPSMGSANMGGMSMDTSNMNMSQTPTTATATGSGAAFMPVSYTHLTAVRQQLLGLPRSPRRR